MNKFYYLEFLDHLGQSNMNKSGNLYLVGKDNIDARILDDLNLKENINGYKYTNLQNLGEQGWELIFVTPCGYSNNNFGGPITNSYIFRKVKNI